MAGALLAFLLFAAAAPPPAAPALFADDGSQPAAWKAVTSDGVEAKLSAAPGATGKALRFDVDFHGGAGYAIARRAVKLTLPANFVLRLDLKGDLPPNQLEVKLVDPSGDNVWWSVRRGYTFPKSWQSLQLRKRHFEFAWGPAGGGPASAREVREIGAIEIAVAAGEGGKGTLWIDGLTIEERPAEHPYAGTPVARVTPTPKRAGKGEAIPDPALAIDNDYATAWEMPPKPEGAETGTAVSLTIDFGEPRELGGLRLDWDPARRPLRYGVQLSQDGEDWRLVRSVEEGAGPRDYLALPESEARFVRLRCQPGDHGLALYEAVVEPLAFAASPNALAENVAKDLPRGRLPRSFSGEQSYWTVAGVDGDSEEALLSEDGAVEIPAHNTAAGGFSVEPFLRVGERLLTWADVAPRQELLDGDLPIPAAVWESGDLQLEVLALATGEPGASRLLVRYRLENRGDKPRRAELLLAVRPFQVNPPAQFLNRPGGVAPLRRLVLDGAQVSVEGEPRLRFSDKPAKIAALGFDAGSLTGFPQALLAAASGEADDPQGFATGLAVFELRVPAGGERAIVLEAPLSGRPSFELPAPDAEKRFERALRVARLGWREKLDRVRFDLPQEAEDLAATARVALGQMLVNRDGPALQPGSRAYARSWVRDGALMSAALLRFGLDEPVREYLDWYLGHLFPSGKVPCCVDHRGADPVPENDSHGELLYLAAETYRFTHDRGEIERAWPALERVVGYLERLRQERRTPAYASGDGRRFFGLLPESISHEGYSAKPVHSFWDDFFAYRGLADATFLAGELGKADEQAAWGKMRDELGADIQAAVARTVADHGLAYIPGSVELADYDPTSTTIALAPTGAAKLLPEDLLRNTFDRYVEGARKRARGEWEGDAYTPYELRAVGALVRLGERPAALELLRWFLHDRRPLGWKQWPEVVWRDPRKPNFLGDLPHSWVASDYLRSFLDLFAYEREEDAALVLGAGLPPGWLRPPADGSRGGVGVHGLRTPHGLLDYTVAAERGIVTYKLGAGLAVPRGGLVLSWPLPDSPSAVTIDGIKQLYVPGTEIRLDHVPAEVKIERK